MNATETIRACDLNEKLTDTTNTPKYFHVLLEDFDAGVDPKLGKIDLIKKGTILVEGTYPECAEEYGIWWPTEMTDSAWGPRAHVIIPGDKVVVFKKTITTTYTQV